MDKTIERAAERAIATMRDNLGDQLTVDDMARSAMFSKFHFTRIFQRATGVSPARFLSAMRLQRAKQLLVETTLNVGDISILVGYNSVGTFSARFSRSVGLSPTAYRKLGGFTEDIAVREARGSSDLPMATVQGHVRGHRQLQPGVVFLGLFPERVPEGMPVRCTILDSPGAYRFDDVPPGSWYLLAQSVATTTGPDGVAAEEAEDGSDLSVGTHGPIVVRRDAVNHSVDLHLKPARTLDPPVLLALLDARKLARARQAAAEAPTATTTTMTAAASAQAAATASAQASVETVLQAA